MANDSYQLVVRNAPQSGLAPGQVIALEDDVLTMGRDPLSDIILDDPEVSRHHAKLLLQAGGYAVQDMGSTNGSFVDGKRLTGEPLALKPGQVIMLGSNVTLVYQAIVAVDPLATVVAPVAAAQPEMPAEPEEIVEEVEAAEEVVAEAEEEVEAAAPAVVPADLELEEVEEPEVIAEEFELEDEEEDFATMMDESPIVPPFVEAAPEPEPFPEVEVEPFPQFEPGAESEPLPEVEAEPFPEFELEPLPELPAEPELFEEEPAVAFEPPPVPEPPVATFDEFEERTFVDSAAPVSDYAEMPPEPVAIELPPASPPPIPDLGEPEAKGKSNRNLIIIAVVAVLLICCCIAIAAGIAISTNGFANF